MSPNMPLLLLEQVFFLCASLQAGAYSACVAVPAADTAVIDHGHIVDATLERRHPGTRIERFFAGPIKLNPRPAAFSGHGTTAKAMSPIMPLLSPEQNLKKSWHPSTLRNVERVWKAELVRDQEKAKIEQLQKELQEERDKQEMRQYAENKGVVKKKQERLDWMYQGVAGLVDREQYLLGRKVDKNFEIMKKEEDGVEDKNEDQQPGSIFTMAPTNAAVDLENKIREDPLFAIKKQEMKTKKTLLSNPVKMKHLKEMHHHEVETQLKRPVKSSSRSHSKRKRHDSNSSDSSAEEDHRNSENSQRLGSPVLKSNDKRPKFGLIVRGNQSRKKEQQPPPVKVQPKEHKQNKTAPQATQKRRPLSEEEKATARREMMKNAQEHDEKRKTIVNQYRKSEAAEEKNHHKSVGGGFIRPMLAKAADTGSVENRIKQKMYTVQRTSSAMDVHFARK
ncbi:hypothetical protein HPB51_021026 [Rhipicephalus microplus]|uniref:CBF1-interacting co-repressor CIR N-terminal domain-containing protein n=1 Tax=Rhipicephalus microplus TaxID=6941 RepID=A0A9J6DCA7_RHIMP|nr:hypothetical protein HPB51_021026 [Rhipicephalus microplus]